MPRQSLIANVGTMPFETYIRKYEQTGDFAENSNQMHNYQRELLTDWRPDKPYLESDMPRRENMGETQLNVRYFGTRSQYTPQLPDGTFLDYEFLAADPRGFTTEPNWNKYTEEGVTRSYDVKFTSDDDYTVHESPIGGFGMSDRRSGMLDEFRQRWKNFSTSQDGWTSGILPPRTQQSKLCQVAVEQNGSMVEEGVCYNKSNIVPYLSNVVPMGYQTTGDHEFQIASYSQVRSTRSLAEDDWTKNRNNTYHDQDLYISYKDNTVPKSIAMSMIDMSQKKYNETQSLRNYKFANSKDSGPSRQQKFIADHMKNSAQTLATLPKTPLQEEDAYAHGGSQYVPRYGSTGAAKKKTKLTHELAEAMTNVQRGAGKQAIGDLRGEVLLTILNQESTMQGTRARRTDFITKSFWEGVEDRKINGEAEKTVYNFKKIKPKIYSKTDEIDNTTFDDYKATSRSLDVRALPNVNTMDMYVSAMADGIDFREQKTAANPAVGSGSRYNYDKMLKERDAALDVFDI